tara:strand:+ start:225 stop:740 length:516 start_codon:yes stop_codon:yes gene_type:complete
MLEYQKQNCDLTLAEGLQCYYDSFPKNKEIFVDTEGSETLLRDHDCTHVIFGLDISLDQEAILDTWVLWGSKFKWSYLLGYNRLPQIKELTKYLFKELGVIGFLRLYWNVVGVKRKVVFRVLKMKKKWPFQVPERYLNMKISDLRKMHGIVVLKKEDLNYAPLVWSGSIDN